MSDAYVDAAEQFIADQLRTVEHINAMRVDDTPDNCDPVVAVTVTFISQATVYEVWEVVFCPNGYGTYGRVAASNGLPGQSEWSEFEYKNESYVPSSILIGKKTS
jgi:hypothetical protein